MGVDPKTNQQIKPTFEKFMHTLEALVNSFKYDNQEARNPRPSKTPSQQQQKEYMEEKLMEYKFDGMPKKENQLYHIVSAEWFQNWKRYVGIPLLSDNTNEQDESTQQSSEQQSKHDIHQDFKNIKKKNKK